LDFGCREVGLRHDKHKNKTMVYTISNGLRDREYDKFVADAGSNSAVAVAITSGNISVSTIGALNPFQNYAVAHTIGSTLVWPATAGSRLVVTDVLVSTGSGTNEQEVRIAAGSMTNPVRMTTYLAGNGGFISNLHTPLRTTVGGSIIMLTSTVGSTSITLGGYIE